MNAVGDMLAVHLQIYPSQIIRAATDRIGNQGAIDLFSKMHANIGIRLRSPHNGLSYAFLISAGACEFAENQQCQHLLERIIAEAGFLILNEIIEQF